MRGTNAALVARSCISEGNIHFPSRPVSVFDIDNCSHFLLPIRRGKFPVTRQYTIHCQARPGTEALLLRPGKRMLIFNADRLGVGAHGIDEHIFIGRRSHSLHECLDRTADAKLQRVALLEFVFQDLNAVFLDQDCHDGFVLRSPGQRLGR